jgi:predicted metalloendopeptidase
MSLLYTSSIFLRVNALQTATSSLHSMLDWMDTSVDPCDDFYQYACGNFLKQHANATKRVRIFDNDDQYKEIASRLNSLFKDEIIDKPEDHPFVKVHRLYQSCMAADEKESLYNLQFTINQALENNSFDTLKGRSKAWALAYSQGVYSVFALSVGREIMDAKTAGLYASKPRFGIGIESFKDKVHLDAYREYITDVFNASSEYIKNQPKDVVQVVLAFESALAEIAFTDNMQMDTEKLNKRIPMSEFKSIIGKWIDFDDVFKTLQLSVTVDYITPCILSGIGQITPEHSS